MAKIRKTEYYPSFDIYNSDLNHVKEQIERLIEQYGGDATLHCSDTDVEYTLTHWYEETPGEEATRLVRLATAEAMNEKYQRQQYEALKKKFEV